MTQNLCAGWIVLLAILFPTAHAQSSSFSELQFKSAHDAFTLRRAGGAYTLDGKPVNLGSFKEILPLFAKKLEEDGCPNATQAADLTVKATVDGQVIERKFHVKDRLMTDGAKLCAEVTGEGLFFLPLHRSWFVGPNNESIKIERSFHLMRKNETLVHLEKNSEGEWSSRAAGFPNWEFFQRFADSLANYNIISRLHSSVAEGKDQLTMLVDGKSYQIAHVSTTTWAVRGPKSPWFVAANEWTFWSDMDKMLWRDRFEETLKTITDNSVEESLRVSSLEAIKRTWSPSIRDALHSVLKDPQAGEEIWQGALNLVRKKPTRENFRLLIDLLDKTKDLERLASLTSALRVRNPKGPLLTEDSDATTRRHAITEWKAWWQSVKDSKDKF